MNHSCPTCQRPIDPATAVTLGTVVLVRFCHPDCRAAWVSTHDRRRQSVWVPFERRVAS
jgi:hypothetical protein